MFETVEYDVRGKTAWITLNRPDKLNAFTAKLNKEVGEAVRKASRDNVVRAIVLTGAGRAFCSGQDLSDVNSETNYAEILRNHYNPMVLEIEKCEKPIIAAVNGVAAGAGMSLALACDFRIVSEKASFLQAFIHVGLVPDAGNLYYLPRIVGHAKAIELAVLGEKVSAEEANRLGLVTKLVPADSFLDETAAFADRLASMPTKAIGLIKRNLKASWDASIYSFLDRDAQSQRIASLTEDHQEGVTAFLEKRKPEFRGC
ncbi:2-(1,2-epoxy-1,2-dihydrophenyl)acetyl-CoA isomerase [Bacillus sp. FJAT-27225]|uniref:enoyl-CoA hydratase-related protein n=1 Tax=Bacillus sp. FJAT-27225 TaxID=1743144 RepID=UPI00080C30C5|nr:enoyl-CoA hydratase-related protein [Bacillus sp. FJAT-27225]OCA91517.1 2-(1,2-epoxy-1,2-dihydrophenyl)acetyl-CoA isomerase [Bacillus sp. FJAT-27225]